MSHKKTLILFVVGFVVLIGVVSLIVLLLQKDENQFGKFIRIQNYDSKVKNLSGEMRDGMESYLYNIVVKNIENADTASRVGDAVIRDESDTQDYASKTQVYSGDFIVDMQSIKQSYRVQYSYSSNDSKLTEGNPIVISCLPVEALIYGDFNCTDFVSEQAGNNDIILQYLPYKNFSFSITPDATQGDVLVLIVDLDIPQIDLSGSAASRAETVARYKKEVTSWIESKGIDADTYKLQYNYDDSGNMIRGHEPHGDL